MNVKDFKKHLENLPDDLEIVTYGNDHSFHPISSFATLYAEKRILEYGTSYVEYYSDERMQKDATKVRVVWIG